VRRELAPGDREEHEDDGEPRQEELSLAIAGEPRAPQRGEEKRDRREEPGEEHGDEVVDRPRAAVPGRREALEMLVDEEEVEKARVALLGEKEPGRRGEQEGRERGAGEERGKEPRSAREEAPEEKDPTRQHDRGQALAQESSRRGEAGQERQGFPRKARLAAGDRRAREGERRGAEEGQ